VSLLRTTNYSIIALFTQQEKYQKITSYIVIIAQDPKQHLLRTKIKKKTI